MMDYLDDEVYSLEQSFSLIEMLKESWLNKTSLDMDMLDSVNSSVLGTSIKSLLNALIDMEAKPECLFLNSSTIACDNSKLHNFLLGYMYPIVLVLCIFGNGINVGVYCRQEMRTSTTIKMLMAKAVVNTIFMVCLLPNFFLMTIDNNTAAYYLWTVWPYMLCIANVCGSTSTWLTVFMTLERYLFVVWPIRSKELSTTANFVKLLISILFLSFCLHLQIPVSRFIESTPCGDEDNYVHRMYLRSGSFFSSWEIIHAWLNLTVTLLTPNVLLIILTILLTRKLIYSSMPTYKERKRCVTRITMATTASHLILEAPAMGVYLMAALYGSEFINEDPSMCICHVVTNFTNQLNASVCFLIYTICSKKFRSMVFGTGMYDAEDRSKTNMTCSQEIPRIINRNHIECVALINSNQADMAHS